MVTISAGFLYFTMDKPETPRDLQSLLLFFSSDHRGRTLLLSRLISIRDVSMNNYGKSSFARLNRGVVVLKSFIALIKNLMNNVSDVRKRRKMCIHTHNRSNLNNSSSLRDLFLAIVSRFHGRSPGSVCRSTVRDTSPDRSIILSCIASHVIITRYDEIAVTAKWQAG